MVWDISLTEDTKCKDDFTTDFFLKGTFFHPLKEFIWEIYKSTTRSFRTGFFNLYMTDISGQMNLCCWRLCCALEDIQQQPWPLSVEPVAASPATVSAKNVSGHCQMSPGLGGKTVPC